MPVVHRFDGMRVVVYSNDHRPAHVHVKGAAGDAVFVLHCPGGPPTVRETYGFKRHDLNRIIDELNSVLALLCAEWSAVHGRI